MMHFSDVCLVTAGVPRLSAFYRTVLQVEPEGDDTHADFALEGGGLAIFDLQGMEHMAPGSMAGTGAGACVLLLEVEDCDGEYYRFAAAGVPVVKTPATYPWGARSAWFRDPDGNIVDIYSAVDSD